MKIKCYGPEVLSEENKKYLFEEVDFDGKYEIIITKILKLLSILIVILFVMAMISGYLVNYKINLILTSKELFNLFYNLILGSFVLLLILIVIKKILELIRKAQEKNEGVIIDLIKEMVFIENKNEKKEFMERDKNTFLGSLKVSYRKNLDSGKEKIMFVKLYDDEYKQGEIIDYHEFDNGLYVLLRIEFLYQISKMKRRKAVENYFVIITKNDFNNFKKIENEYKAKIY